MIQIGGLQKVTLIDFPGRLACTVFLTGCNFRCPFCYASELVLPEKIKNQPKISEKELFKFLKERKKLIDGVVLCGGEPTMSRELIPLIKKIKKMGFFVKLDTNGSDPKILKKLIDEKLIDYVALDIKGPKERYNEFVGKKVDVKKIQESIDILKEGRVDYEFRSTIVPTLHTKEDVIEMAKWIRGTKRYYLQNFRPEKTIDPKFEKIKPYPQEYLLKIQKAIAPFFEICQVR
ncbi:MAG: anaerobic ribonucleoside-triphosphate reductase activating protein [Candidatus Nealsonbacteria bacterium CG_4_8_14_3_um_filter_37_36]|uniref:Anaerobic ribonucleoside-triphosphate reductase activating protein n=4 Tax=Candidatus Nealsoniibacteriota TaxID=1817911 RepID=A0A2M7EAX6_9BACT|nr:MAG: anaerobic ribonucleoside-triphosphate reductase activating protein [Candidatus Nealsonbacteria bacterium CG01_land_8_20_14_3_00_12]PIW34909.1 MAG: anaerobic ribonucleoside-triphosphate reductase activating protein [Candidatus Nealsonbacteria bacterium CG15_BIG_FIL_POST_REV_8_21_14_020_37_12]PIW91502.1 MAG: anaerobic ribonucleoside-triphosphate reductase activating protein [Candidatus Nealsonbacteria bacterium CG_4_8_14_3_um_filter_37_36]PJA83351.1 MAG: anaerobic ribonucleoside-triphospha